MLSKKLTFSQIKASILEDVFSRQECVDTVGEAVTPPAIADTNVLAELKVLYPGISSFGINSMILYNSGSSKADTVNVAFVNFRSNIRPADRVKLEQWLRVRYKTNRLRLVVQ